MVCMVLYVCMYVCMYVCDSQEYRFAPALRSAFPFSSARAIALHPRSPDWQRRARRKRSSTRASIRRGARPGTQDVCPSGTSLFESRLQLFSAPAHGKRGPMESSSGRWQRTAAAMACLAWCIFAVGQAVARTGDVADSPDDARPPPPCTLGPRHWLL